MAVVTIMRLSEEILKMLSGGDIQNATNISFNELKISIGQVCNQILKVEHFSVNEKMGERIPNGSVLGFYSGIAVSKYGNGKSKCSLPIKPLKLPRNMGVFSVWLTGYPEKEFIPLQMGQANLIISQPLINDLLGQVGYENFGIDLVFTKDLTISAGANQVTVDMRLAIMDISQYGDFDPLPILPEMEWQVKQEVLKLYSSVGIADMLVDNTTKQQQNIPLPQQQQT